MGGIASTFLLRETIFHAFSGAIASATSVSVFYPLETVRTRKQVSRISVYDESSSRPILIGLIRSLRRIYLQEGLRGLYRGYWAVVWSLFFSNFVYFYAYVALKAVFEPFHSNGTHHRNPSVDLFTAFLAGSFNVFVTTPLWVASTRLRLSGVDPEGENTNETAPQTGKNNACSSNPSSNRAKKYQGLLQTIVTIFKEEGLSALYSGTIPSLVLVLNPAIQWTIYECLKLHCQSWSGKTELSAATYFVTSAIAKLFSSTATYPLQVVQTRLRMRQSSHQTSRVWTMADVLLTMMKEEGGIGGLFKGLESKIVQTVLTSAFMFVVYEKVVAAMTRLWLA